MVKWGRIDKGGREPDRTGASVREPGRGLLWGTGMLGFSEAFLGEVAQQATPSAPDKAARSAAGDIDEDRVYELLGQLLDVGSEEGG